MLLCIYLLRALPVLSSMCISSLCLHHHPKEVDTVRIPTLWSRNKIEMCTGDVYAGRSGTGRGIQARSKYESFLFERMGAGLGVPETNRTALGPESTYQTGPHTALNTNLPIQGIQEPGVVLWIPPAQAEGSQFPIGVRNAPITV